MEGAATGVGNEEEQMGGRAVDGCIDIVRVDVGLSESEVHLISESTLLTETSLPPPPPPHTAVMDL